RRGGALERHLPRRRLAGAAHARGERSARHRRAARGRPTDRAFAARRRAPRPFDARRALAPLPVFSRFFSDLGTFNPPLTISSFPRRVLRPGLASFSFAKISLCLGNRRQNTALRCGRSERSSARLLERLPPCWSFHAQQGGASLLGTKQLKKATELGQCG